MSPLSPRDRSRIRQLTERLDTFVDRDPPALNALLPELGELIEVHTPFAYLISNWRGERTLEFGYFRGASTDLFSSFCAAIRSAPADWLAYDPDNPPRPQRNRALTKADLPRIGSLYSEFPRYGLTGDQLRALVCDGDTLLAWVGGFAPEFSPEAKLRLQALVPGIRRRLILERQLVRAAFDAAALAATLDAISAPAFVLSETGRVAHANASARALAPAELRETLRSALDQIKGRGPPRFALTVLSVTGLPRHYLAVLREARPELPLLVSRAASRWSLTARQRQVLDHLVAGAANKDIAARLGCSVRTVELHVTAILEKTGAESRSELAARVLDLA